MTLLFVIEMRFMRNNPALSELCQDKWMVTEEEPAVAVGEAVNSYEIQFHVSNCSNIGLCCVAHVHFPLLLVLVGVVLCAAKSNKSPIYILHGVLSPSATRTERWRKTDRKKTKREGEK